jgi:hypothetical protein
MERCASHVAELAAGTCRTCGGSFCETCLVWTYGRTRSPHCVPCAVDAAHQHETRRVSGVPQGVWSAG